MRLSTAVTLALTVLLATSAVGVVAATPSATALESEPAPTVADQSSLEQPAIDRTLFQSTTSPTAFLASSTSADALSTPPGDAGPEQTLRISLDDTGNANWAIEHRFILTDDDEVDDFQAYADAVEAGERDLDIDRQWFEIRADEAADRTDREMSIEDAGWDDSRVHAVEDDEEIDGDALETDNESDVRVGVITYSFTWTNFATAENDRIHVGDAFQSDTGVWLSLAETQRLVIEHPDGYFLETASTLEWDGPYEFSDDELDIAFVRSGGALLGLSGWVLGGILLLVIGVGVGSYLLARRDPDRDLPAPIEDLPERVAGLGLTGIVGRIRSRAVGREDRQAGRRSTAAADTDGGTVEPTSGAAIDPTAPADGTRLEFEEDVNEGIDPELLSDEERVLRMLKQNGGRMKQASIVTETGWSNAKVSQLLSQMDDDDEIEKLRIGRENLITLPEVDPTELD